MILTMNSTLVSKPFLTPHQAAHTDGYLRQVSETFPTASVRLQSLFGRCCLAAVSDFQGPDGVDAAKVVADMSAYAETLLRDPNANQLGLDPLLLVEADWLLQHAGRAVPALRPLTARVAKELSAQPEKISSLGRVRLLTSRLRSLGYATQDIAPHRGAAILLKNVSAWVNTPLAELGDLVDHLMANQVDLDSTQSEALSLIALAELRNYRVDVGCKVLRLVLQQGEISEETTEALNYVAVQRRRNGSYGFINPFQEKKSDAAPSDLSLHLPMTLNAAWLFYTASLDTVRRPELAEATR